MRLPLGSSERGKKGSSKKVAAKTWSLRASYREALTTGSVSVGYSCCAPFSDASRRIVVRRTADARAASRTLDTNIGTATRLWPDTKIRDPGGDTQELLTGKRP